MILRACTFILLSAGVMGAQESSVTLGTTTGHLHGTLSVPGGRPPVPVLLIVPGSGPTDRDGNNPLIPGSNNSLRMLAASVRDMGVASLRYDKRGVGSSKAAGQSERDVTVTTYVDDVVAWIQWLRRDASFSKVFIAGHSEGALVATIAARRERVDGLVLLAGAGRPILEVLTSQLEQGVGRTSQTFQDAVEIMNALRRGHDVDSVPAPLRPFLRPSAQPYLRSWLPLDPAEELAHLDIPVLIVQGTTDLQTTVEDARRLHASYPNGTLALVTDMNHVLKRAVTAAEQTAAYTDPTVPLHADLVRTLGSFLVK